MSPLSDRRVALALVALAGALVYAGSLGNGFAFDDVHIVSTNTAIQSPSSLPGALLRPYWPGDYGRDLGLWRPTTTALLGIQHILGGGSALVFHAVNVLGHVLASVLVLLLLAELMPLAGAFAAALVFAAHPVHVEAVANVVGLAEVASTAAILGACLVHVRAGPVTGWRPALAVGVLYVLGFGAKESAVTLPGLIFLLDAARSRIGFAEVPAYVRDRWRAYGVMGVAAVGMLAARFAVLGSVARPLGPLGADLLQEVPRIWTLAEVWTHYVRLWVFPLDLSPDYSPDLIPISLGWNATNTVGVVLALSVLAVSWLAWRRPALTPETSTPRTAAFGVVWFLIAISPVSNALFLSGVLLAERTLYLPSVGLAAATGWLVVRAGRARPRATWGVACAAVLALGARSWTRAPIWADNATLLGDLIEEYPYNGRSQWILGDAMMRQGRVPLALASYRAAIGILGTHYQLLTEISKQLVAAELYRPAERLLEIAADNEPGYALAYSLLALIRAEHGDAAGTERYARASLERWPVDPTRLHLLAWALAVQERWEEAQSVRGRAEAQAAERGEEEGTRFWQRYVYEAYAHRERGDSAGAQAALETAWERVATTAGRVSLDSVGVAEFGLESRLQEGLAAGDSTGR